MMPSISSVKSTLLHAMTLHCIPKATKQAETELSFSWALAVECACLSELCSKSLQLCLFLQQLSLHLLQAVSGGCCRCGLRGRVYCLESVLYLAEPAQTSLMVDGQWLQTQGNQTVYAPCQRLEHFQAPQCIATYLREPHNISCPQSHVSQHVWCFR